VCVGIVWAVCLQVRTTKAPSCCGSIGVSRHKARSKPVKWAATGKLTRRRRRRKLFRMQRKRRKKRSPRSWRTGKLSKLGKDTIVAVSLPFCFFTLTITVQRFLTWHGARTICTSHRAPQTQPSTFGTSTSTVSFLKCDKRNLICLDPLKILECKANGLTFDPFGKFLAS
jgi:hypothetical protein